MAIVSGDVVLSAHYLRACINAYEDLDGTPSTFYIEGVDATRAALIDLTAARVRSYITGLGGSSPHGPTAVTPTITATSTNINFDFADLSGTFTDNGSGTTVALVLYTDVKGTATGDSRVVMGADWKPHSIVADSTDDNVTFAATYTFQIQCA